MDWDAYFNEFVYKWMFHDINVAIENKANYLAALGLCVYIEVLGAIKNGNWGKSNKKDWYTFLNDMNPNYSTLEDKIQMDNALYDRIRCGLAHEHWIKEGAVIQRKIIDTHNQGIRYNEKTKVIQISLIDLFNEFKKAAIHLHNELKLTNRNPPAWSPGISGDFSIYILGKTRKQ